MLRNLYNNFEIEVTIISDIYDEDENQQEILIKEGATRKETIYLDDIKSVGQVWKINGKIDHNRTYLQHVDLGRIIVKGKYKYFRDLKFPKLNNKSNINTKIGYGK